MLTEGTASLAWETEIATLREPILRSLVARFPEVPTARWHSSDPAPTESCAIIWFGDPAPRPSVAEHASIRVCALRSSNLTGTAVEQALAAGTTHFLSDALPDELPIDFSQSWAHEWLHRFVFLPPCPRDVAGAPLARRSGQALIWNPAAGELPTSVFEVLAAKLDLKLLSARELEECSDATLTARIGRFETVGVFAQSPQFAQRLAQLAKAAKVAVFLSADLRVSPLRFCPALGSAGGLTPTDAAGPVRRLTQQLLALHLRAVPRSLQTGTVESMDSTAAHLLSALGITSFSAEPERQLWRTHPAWQEWSECRDVTPVAARLPAHRLTGWARHGGSPALTTTLPAAFAAPAARHLWLEYTICTGHSPAPSIVRAYLDADENWAENCDRVFTECRSLEPKLPDLRAPMARALAELAVVDPASGDRHGIPAEIIRWLDADDTDRQQTADGLLQRALAHARWADFATATALVQKLQAEDPGRRGLAAQVVMAKLGSLHGGIYIESQRAEYRPILEELQALLARDLRADASHIETEIISYFLRIYCDEIDPTLERLEQAMTTGEWPPLMATRLTVQLLFSGHIKAGCAAATWVARRADELLKPFDLAFASAALTLAGRFTEADALDARRAAQAPQFYATADAFTLQTRALAQARRGELVAARESFAHAVALRPALALGRPYMDAIVAQLTKDPDFSFIPLSS